MNDNIPVNVHRIKDHSLVGAYPSMMRAEVRLWFSTCNPYLICGKKNKNGKPKTTFSKLLKEKVYLIKA